MFDDYSRLVFMKPPRSLCYTLVIFLTACGGGEYVVTPKVATHNPQALYRSIVLDPKNRTYNVVGTLFGKPFVGAGEWSSNTVSSALRGQIVYSQTISFKEFSISIDGVAQKPEIDSITNVYDMDVKYLGSESNGKSKHIRVTKYADLPKSARIGDSGDILEYISYSDSSKTNPVSRTTERWALIQDAQSSSGVVLQIVRASIFTDPAQAPNPLVYTEKYIINASDGIDILSRDVYLFSSAGVTSLKYDFR
jgi:hypothetical protein